MSLVAYDSSGEDSDGEDSSDNGQAVGPKLLKQQSKPETERDDLPCAHNEREQSRDISSHERENDSGKELDDDILERKEEKKPRKSIFSFLPPPSKQKAEDLELSEEDDGMILKQRNKLEKEGFHDKVEKRESTVDKYEANDLKRIKKLSLPEPKRSMEREKQKVKITIPSLPQEDSDSDEEENKATKKQRLGKGHSGLLGCLPQPKFSSAINKAAGTKPNERKPSKLYVPYTLSKKKDVNAKSDSKLIEKGNNSDSDDEGPSNSFFSFGESVKNPKEDFDHPNKASFISRNTEGTKEKTFLATSENNIGEAVSSPTVDDSRKEINKVMLQSQEKSIDNTNDASFSTLKAAVSQQVSAIDIKKMTVGNISSDVTGPYESSITGPYKVNHPGLYTQPTGRIDDQITGPYKAYSGSHGGTYSGEYGGVYNEGNSAAYNGTYHGTSGSHWGNSGYHQANTMDQYGHYGPKAYLNPEPDNQHSQFNTRTSGHSEDMESIDADQLRRLQGKRERRVQEIDIIDIHGEQVQCDASMLLKNITEEKTHMPKRSKSDLPSSQQKRKHQITYLAFQAKERENELRKSWAANLQTKRQTQQKYGF